MIDRIKKIMDSENMSAGRFADEIGIIGSRLSHYLSGRNNVSLDLIMKILERFRGINPEWLIFGRGEMYKTADSKPTPAVSNVEPDLFNGLPPASDGALIENEDENLTVSDTMSDISDSEQLKTNEEVPSETVHDVVSQEPIDVPKRPKTHKTIEKILVMYTDSTFDCYSPNGRNM